MLTLSKCVVLGTLLCVNLLCVNVAGCFADVAKPEREGPAPAKIKTIWDYKQTLGLTDEQVEQMKGALAKLQKDLVDYRQKLVGEEKQLRALIAEDGSLDEIEVRLKKISALQVRMRLADIRTSKVIHGTLDTEQHDKWTRIQKSVRAAKTTPAAPAPRQVAAAQDGVGRAN